MMEKTSSQHVLPDPEVWGVILVWSCLLLLPFSRTVEAPVLIMALFGAVLIAKKWREWRYDRRIRLFCCVFAASWLPMLISLPDAVNVQKTGEVVLNHLRFLFSGLFLLHVLRDQRTRKWLTCLIGWLVAFWIIDALIQYWKGTDLFGIEPFPGRLSAMFGADNSKFGLTLAVFAPVLWEYVRRKMGLTAVVIAVLVTVSVVVLSAQRTAWILVAAAVTIYVFCLSLWMKVLPVRQIAVIAIAAAIYAAGSYAISEKVQSGVSRALAPFAGEIDLQSNSMVHRIWIWKRAWAMFLDNPVNGVGARGFRYAYEDYARSDDPYLKQENPIVPTHSHQLVIEVGTETGTVGLVGLLLMWVLLVRAAIETPHPYRADLLPYVACAGAAYFPLNSHLAIYSAYWSQIVWYLLALYCAAALGKSEPSALASAEETRLAEK